MKIMLLMDNPIIPTGYASTCRLTARELMKRGHKIYATCFNGGPSSKEPSDWFGITILPNYALEREKNAIYGDAQAVKRMYDEIKPDLLFWHNDSYRYSYMKDLPEEILSKSIFWLPFEGEVPDAHGVSLFGKCAATRFVTKHALDIHKDQLKDKDIGFIPHAIDLDNLGRPSDQRAAKAGKQYGIEDKFVVLRVDRHQPRKYWDRTIKAFAKFAEDKDDVCMLAKCNPRDITMYKPDGKDGKPEGMDLQALCEQLGIQDKVKFDDYFFDDSYMAAAFFHPSDVFVTTTAGEGFGLTPCEAMACGVPVIAPAVPVLPEVLGGDDDRDQGGALFTKVEGRLYYEPMHVWHNLAEVDDVADKLEWAYNDWKDNGGRGLREVGNRGMDLARRKYSPKVVYDQWDQVFKDVIDKENLVSVITVLYNLDGEEYLHGEDGVDRFRETIEEHVKTPYEWIVVDNGSPCRDLTRKWMRSAAENNPRIKTVFLDDNMGFAGGNNAAIAQARGKWVVLANPDSEALDPVKQRQPADFLKMLVDTAKNDPKIGIAGMETNSRDDILQGADFPYFCCVLITRECLDAVKLGEDKWLDERFWPAYYEDLALVSKARSKGFKIVENKGITFWHKSGGTNKHAIKGGKDGPYVKHFEETISRLEKSHPDMADWPRKRAELKASGMAGLIEGNIALVNQMHGVDARKKIKLVWHTHIGDGVGFSQIVEGIAPALDRAGFDVYVNDWSNGGNIEDPEIRRLWEKYKKANLDDGLDDAIHVVCWLMETFLNVDADFKVGISFCESTKVRESYLQACNGMDRILTFSEFCRGVQKDSGFTSPIDVIPPGVHPIYLKYQDRPRRKDKFTYLSVGVSQGRKDVNRLVEWFCEMFPRGRDRDHLPECEPGYPYDSDQVELVLKSNVFGALDWVEPHKKRANIRTIFTGKDERAERKDFTMEEMRALYDEADCLVHPSHGEGIGLPICESAATGLPVVFTNWSSPAEYLDESNSYPVSLSPYPGTTFTQAYAGAPGDNGVWSNIHAGHCKHRMREVMRRPEEAKEKGKKAAEHMAKNFNWDNTVKQLTPLLFEWEEQRKRKGKTSGFDPLTFVKPKLEPVRNGDRCLIDLCSRDRHLPLCCLLTSLLGQTFKNWDILIECDDSDESMPNDFMIMSLMGRIQHEGHGWRIIRSHRQGPHIAHDRTLRMAADDPQRNYKLVCRIDDDIIVRTDYLENLYKVFLADAEASIAAVGGVYLDPKRPDAEQYAPKDYEKNVDYAGSIDHNVPWPYVCRYPDGTAPRPVEHLYSSFMYRVEVGMAIGGYCRKFSQIGHREESDFSYRFHLAGFKQFIQPSAIGYHYQVPSGGIRSGEILDKNALASMDHQIYEKRLQRWKKRMALRKQLDAKKPDDDTSKKTVAVLKPSTRGNDPLAEAPKSTSGEMRVPPPVTKGKLVTVINGGEDLKSIQDAIDIASKFSAEVYVTCDQEESKKVLSGKKLCMVASSSDESAMLTKSLASDGDHEFIMTVSDTMRFRGDPMAIVDDDHDNYVFEVYTSYLPGRVRRDASGNATFVHDESVGVMVGPECENRCLMYRRRNRGNSLEYVLYSDIMVVNEKKIPPVNGKSLMGNDLMKIENMDRVKWKKICTYQFPEGKLKDVRYIDVNSSGSPLVSIVIPTTSRVKHLRRCLDSIYSHTTTPFEVIVVDNGSTDGTREILDQENQKSNFSSIMLPANVGYQRAINLGIGKTKGKYLLLFNDDAWVESMMPDGRDWVRTLIDALEANPKIGIVGPHGGKSPALGDDLLYFWCVLMRKSLFNKVGPMDDISFFNYGGDDDYAQRVKASGYEMQVVSGFEGILRHLMNLVPADVKKAELEESVRKLKAKYSG